MSYLGQQKSPTFFVHLYLRNRDIRSICKMAGRQIDPSTVSYSQRRNAFLESSHSAYSTLLDANTYAVHLLIFRS